MRPPCPLLRHEHAAGDHVDAPRVQLVDQRGELDLSPDDSGGCPAGWQSASRPPGDFPVRSPSGVRNAYRGLDCVANPDDLAAPDPPQGRVAGEGHERESAAAAAAPAVEAARAASQRLLAAVESYSSLTLSSAASSEKPSFEMRWAAARPARLDHGSVEVCGPRRSRAGCGRSPLPRPRGRRPDLPAARRCTARSGPLAERDDSLLVGPRAESQAHALGKDPDRLALAQDEQRAGARRWRRSGSGQRSPAGRPAKVMMRSGSRPKSAQTRGLRCSRRRPGDSGAAAGDDHLQHGGTRAARMP